MNTQKTNENEKYFKHKMPKTELNKYIRFGTIEH